MFRTSHSDTELLLLGLSEFGLSFLDEIVGQFAIAFVNFKSKKLILIRDRIGQKPLFYSLGESKILFSSNLKSILKYEDKKRIDIRAINNYLNDFLELEVEGSWSHFVAEEKSWLSRNGLLPPGSFPDKHAIMFLACPLAGYLTGNVLYALGGMMLILLMDLALIALKVRKATRRLTQ